MFNKRGIELSMNFLVILIISLVIFGFGILFISRLSSEANNLSKIGADQLDQRISGLICEGSERVCMGIERQTIQRNKFGVFGVKIFNLEDSQEFEITVLPSNPIGYDSKNMPIQKTGSFKGLIVVPSLYNNPGRSVRIEKNEEENIGIGIQVPKDAPPGTYIFNVDIKDGSGNAYSKTQKLYVDVQ